MPLGDIFYPDNPKRRARAAQLANDIKVFAVQFDELKKKRDGTATRLKPKLDKLFAKHGLLTGEEIEKKIEANLNSEEMQRYRDLKSRFTLSDEVETIVMGIIDFFAAAAGIVLTIGVVAGIATAGAALAAVGEVVAIAGILIIVASVIEGSHERDELRQVIVDLRIKRVDMQIHLGQMQAIVHWIEQLEIWLDNLDASNPDMVDKLMKSTLVEEYQRWTEEYAQKTLVDLDTSRQSWTDEDHYADVEATLELMLANMPHVKFIQM